MLPVGESRSGVLARDVLLRKSPVGVTIPSDVAGLALNLLLSPDVAERNPRSDDRAPGPVLDDLACTSPLARVAPNALFRLIDAVAVIFVGLAIAREGLEGVSDFRRRPQCICPKCSEAPSEGELLGFPVADS